MKPERKSLVVVCLLLAWGCVPQKPGKNAAQHRVVAGNEGGGVVIAVGEDEVQVDDFNARTKALQAFVSKEKSRDAEIRAVVVFEVLADEAERKGYGKDPRVVNELKNELARQVGGPEQTELIAKLREEADVKIDEAAAQRALEAGKK